MKKELLNGLTAEQIAKVKACKNQDELMKLAKEEGVELTNEQLSLVAGGGLICSTPTFPCPKCGSSDTEVNEFNGKQQTIRSCTCRNCGNKWIA